MQALSHEYIKVIDIGMQHDKKDFISSSISQSNPYELYFRQ